MHRPAGTRPTLSGNRLIPLRRRVAEHLQGRSGEVEVQRLPGKAFKPPADLRNPPHRTHRLLPRKPRRHPHASSAEATAVTIHAAARPRLTRPSRSSKRIALCSGLRLGSERKECRCFPQDLPRAPYARDHLQHHGGIAAGCIACGASCVLGDFLDATKARGMKNVSDSCHSFSLARGCSNAI